MIGKICHDLYRITAANNAKETEGRRLPFSEKELQQMMDVEDPYTIDISKVIDLPPMEFVDALYRLFQYRLNDRKEHWQNMAAQMCETDFKKMAIDTFCCCTNVELYHLKVINNPYEKDGNRLMHLFTRK